MRKLSFALSLASIAFAATTATAQCTFVSPGGTTGGVGAGDDTITSIFTSFPIVFPGGSSTTSIDVDSNGRIFPSGSGDGSDFTESVPEFLGDPHQTIAPFWTDNSVQVQGDLIYTDLGTSAVFHWDENQEFGGTVAFDMWCEIFPDGSWAVEFDTRLPTFTNGVILGTSAGFGAADPGSADLSAGGVSDAAGTAYELFAGNVPTGLAGKRVEFFYDGLGGYAYAETECVIAAFVESTGVPCDSGTPEGPSSSITFAPSGTGGVTATIGSVPFDTVNIGSQVNGGVYFDDGIFNVTLGGSFTLPDGSSYSSLDIDTNGKINAPGTDGSDFTPTGAELAGSPAIAPFFADLSPNVQGDIFFYSDATQTNITFDNVTEFGETNSITFQVQLLHGSDVWTVVLESVSDVDAIGDNLIIGSGAGDAVDPGSIDLSAGYAGGATNTTYELFDTGTPQDLQSAAAPIVSNYGWLSDPEIGTVFQTEVTDIPATAVDVVVLLGVTPLGVPLNIVFPAMSPTCTLEHAVDLGDTGSLTVNPNGTYAPGAATATYDIDLTTAGASAAGFPVKLQAVIVDFTLPWAAQVAVTTTNGISTILGF